MNTTDAAPGAVRNLALPELLLALMAGGLWQHPGDDVLRRVMPWFEDPLVLLRSTERMAAESQSLDLFADDPRSSDVFRIRRGSSWGHPVELPWLDAEQALFIAVNRMPGDDVAVALDYRAVGPEPRVVACDVWSDPKGCSWRIVAPTFSAFAASLGVTGTTPNTPGTTTVDP